MKTLILFLAFLPAGLYTTNHHGPIQERLEKFESKLNIYLDKHQDRNEWYMPNLRIPGPDDQNIPNDQGQKKQEYNMPNALEDSQSFGLDKDFNLRHYWKSDVIYDPENNLYYSKRVGKIWDPVTGKLYEFRRD